jgi:hypothetical protein
MQDQTPFDLDEVVRPDLASQYALSLDDKVGVEIFPGVILLEVGDSYRGTAKA